MANRLKMAIVTSILTLHKRGWSQRRIARDAFWLQGMMGGLTNEFECIKAFSETDFTEDLKAFDVPTVVIHGDDDQIVPIGASALQSAKLVKNVTLNIYEGGPHGLADTYKDQLNDDLLEFLS